VGWIEKGIVSRSPGYITKYAFGDLPKKKFLKTAGSMIGMMRIGMNRIQIR
jgi:hypothetical protein